MVQTDAYFYSWHYIAVEKIHMEDVGNLPFLDYHMHQIRGYSDF
jgi:hypothetical protein